MKNCRSNDVVISGLGITAAVGQGQKAFAQALMKGVTAFDVMARPGRQSETSAFMGAEIKTLVHASELDPRQLAALPLSSQVALPTMAEAWNDAALNDVDPLRIGLIVGGSNVQQREAALTHASLASRPHFVRPSYALTFMDTDVCGVCTTHFAIRGFAFSIGAASASGQVAVIQAAQAVMSGHVDVCIALGALMDLSHWECQALRSLGAMGSDRFAGQAQLAYRPFDEDRDGFIFGESCAALVVETEDSAIRRQAYPYARIGGWGIIMDGNRNPNPSIVGEVEAIRAALCASGVAPRDVDYVNTHGSGSVIGDQTELSALKECQLDHAFLNATKSVTGHGLTSAGAVEIAATLIQMRVKQLHPSVNLTRPIDPSLRWVRSPFSHTIHAALTLSMGFGGVNTALLLQPYAQE